MSSVILSNINEYGNENDCGNGKDFCPFCNNRTKTVAVEQMTITLEMILTVLESY